jgi:hypothetical protein
MATLIEQSDNWVLTLPKGGFKQEFLTRLLDLIRLEELSQKNRMSAEEAWNISEEIKADWWKEYGAALLSKIEASKA